MPRPLEPLITISELHGPEVLFSARAPRGASGFLRDRHTTAGRDVGTAVPVGMAGEARVICPRGCATAEGLDLLRRAGVPLDGRLVVYSDERGYVGRLQAAAREGRKVVVAHYHPLDQLPARAWWVPPAVLSFLNNKANLGRLVPEGSAPHRVVYAPGEGIAALAAQPLPFVLKLGMSQSTGAGMAVRLVRSEAERASAAAALEGGEEIVFEEYHGFVSTLCLNYTTDGRAVRYLGSAAQTADGPAYTGSWVDDGAAAPAGAVALGHAIMEAGRQRGYVGFAGFDVGLQPDGTPLALDLNFRPCGSTVPLVFAEALFRRERRVRCIGSGRLTAGDAATLRGVAREAVEAGVLVPYEVYLPARTTRRTRPSMFAMVLGEDRDAVSRTRAALAGRGLR